MNNRVLSRIPQVHERRCNYTSTSSLEACSLVDRCFGSHELGPDTPPFLDHQNRLLSMCAMRIGVQTNGWSLASRCTS